MMEHEQKAELIIMTAYRNGGYITIEDVLNKFDASYISEAVVGLLDCYGKTGANVLNSQYGWNWYKLSDKGMEFARKGAFSGEKRRELLTRIGAIAAIIAAIAGVLGLFL